MAGFDGEGQPRSLQGKGFSDFHSLTGVDMIGKIGQPRIRELESLPRAVFRMRL